MTTPPTSQKHDFEQNGFTFFPKLFGPAELAELADALREAQARVDSSRLDKGGLTFKHNLFQRSERLQRFIASQKIVDTLGPIIGTDFWCRWDQTVEKQPGGAAFPWHQDNGYNQLADGHFQFWVALTEMTQDNGGLWVQRGSHRRGLRPHHSDSNHLVSEGNETDAVFIPAAPGDALMFSSYTLHRTGKNTTTRPRGAYVIEYMSCDHFDPYIKPPYFIVSEKLRSNPHFTRFFRGRLSVRNQARYLLPRLRRLAHDARVSLANVLKRGPRTPRRPADGASVPGDDTEPRPATPGIGRRTLGATGLQVSSLGVGTWQLAGPVTIDGKPDGYPELGRSAAVDLIRACGDELGINLIDTAPVYGDGEGERRVGEALRGQRDRWIVVTKFGLQRGPTGSRLVDHSPAAIAKSIEGSLRRLATDHIDVCLYHTMPGDQSQVAAGIAELRRLQVAGKLRFVGASTNDPAMVDLLVRAGGCDVLMYSCSLLTDPTEVLRRAGSRRPGTLVRGVFAGGRLTGKHGTHMPAFAADDIRRMSLANQDTSGCERFLPLLPDGYDLRALALRYAVDDAATDCAVLGARSLADYRAATQAMRLPGIDPGLRARLDALRASLQPRRGWSSTLARVQRALASVVHRSGV